MAEATGAIEPRGLTLVGREVLTGVAQLATAVPSCLAAGVLAFAPLGPTYVAAGVAAGLCCLIFAAPAAALASGTAWLIPSPRSSTAVIQASLLATLWRIPALAEPNVALAALALCVLLAGAMQILFGLGGVARIVKFTPHPVLAGFLNGVALLLCLPQLERYVSFSNGPSIIHPFMLVFMLALAGATILGRRFTLKVAGALFGLATGIVGYYALEALAPGLDLGPTMGAPGAGHAFLPALPFIGLKPTDLPRKIVPLLPDLVLTALSLAIVATFDTLLTLRVAQKTTGRPLRPTRDLVANGIGNCVAALTGSLAVQLSPNVVINAYKSGGRTALTPIVGALVLLAIVLTLSPQLGAIPVVVLSATVLANGIASFDRWSLRLLLDTLLNRGRVARRHAWHDILVILVVMSITASGAIVAGVLAGAALACIIFIANMSRPILRRSLRGNEIASKRMRPADAQAALLESGPRRAVLELQGVLFFGNADDLADRVVALLDETDMVTLDVHGITDIDISGAQVLIEIVANARRRGKWLVFCSVPPDLTRSIGELAHGDARAGARIMHDLDSSVEWMEEEALNRRTANVPHVDELALSALDFTHGLDADELALLRSRLTARSFAPGETICIEGDAADRLWLLTKGSVSVRMALPGREGVRVASLAMGTVVGEMALLGTGRRSASVVADDDVVCWELEEKEFRALLDEHPRIASKVLANIAREMARRVRLTSEYLRHALG
ncbi:MAG TPA: SulP family inorganic anion transporter [Stellaceae bacterium]|nr:SulP family inorganic anion transporter [Stellaceae bacterium]